MKQKLFAVLATLALAAVLVLASCAPKTAAAPGQEDLGKPTYGGTLTVLNWFMAINAGEPDSWDPWDAAGPQVIVWSQPLMEQAYEGDIDKYGPKGTGEYGFNNPGWVDEPYYRGNTCESWSWRDDLTLVFKVRKGVYFSGKSINPDVMKRRELTAEDFVYHLKRMKTSPGKGPLFDFVADTVAEDKYTWVVKFKEYYSDWSWWLASAFVQTYPEEVVKAGARDWKNLVGTGPFIFEDYVRGSQATYKKNTDYWGSYTIGGKTYKTPFIDKLVFPVIPDEATQIAALRTAKIDWIQLVKPQYVNSLAESSPDLKKWTWPGGGLAGVDLQCETSKYFKNEAVRRALVIGTDRKDLAEKIIGAGSYDLEPLIKGYPVYVPLEDLSAKTQELFTYDPEKAKKMLADAGFPNGFTITLNYMAGAANEDLASAYAAQWAKIGVTAKLNVLESSVFLRKTYNHDYQDAFLGGATSYPSDTPALSWSGGVYGHEHATSAWKNDEYTNLYNTMAAERDVAKRIAMEKQMVQLLFDGAPAVPGVNGLSFQFAWPWVKNFDGEISAGYCHLMPMVKELWIDQAQKKKLGF